MKELIDILVMEMNKRGFFIGINNEIITTNKSSK